MRNDTVETLIGAAVILIAVVFIVFTYRTTGSANMGGYELTAKMPRVDGIAVGTDVKLAGVKVGSVKALTLDPKDYRVAVHMDLQRDVKIPDDSSVMVTSAGLLGSSYVSIQPGGSDAMLPPNGEIKNAQGSIDMMGLLNKFVNSSSESKSAPAPSTP
jgi:ABC-type transport system involved in resistance to organic solvents, periplasmic component